MNTVQRAAIVEHGLNVLEIFPEAKHGDNPYKLCTELRKIEAKAHDAAEAYCSVEGAENWAPRVMRQCERQLNRLLGNEEDDVPNPVPVFINQDPRGYALKIEDKWMREHRDGVSLHQDWGGYGILAPEIGPKGWE